MAERAEGSLSSYKARRQNGHWPVSMEFPTPLRDRLKGQAEKEQRSMAAVCRIAVERYLDQVKAPRRARRSR